MGIGTGICIGMGMGIENGTESSAEQYPKYRIIRQKRRKKSNSVYTI